MKIDENPTLTKNRDFVVTEGKDTYRVYLTKSCDSISCYKMTDITETKKGMKLILACMDYANKNESNFFEVKER